MFLFSLKIYISSFFFLLSLQPHKQKHPCFSMIKDLRNGRTWKSVFDMAMSTCAYMYISFPRARWYWRKSFYCCITFSFSYDIFSTMLLLTKTGTSNKNIKKYLVSVLAYLLTFCPWRLFKSRYLTKNSLSTLTSHWQPLEIKNPHIWHKQCFLLSQTTISRRPPRIQELEIPERETWHKLHPWTYYIL